MFHLHRIPEGIDIVDIENNPRQNDSEIESKFARMLEISWNHVLNGPDSEEW